MTNVDYLFVREEEGMGASIPSAVSRSVAWFQQMAGVPEGHRLESNQAVDLVVKVLVKKLETKAQPIKRAPRWMTMMIGPMEEMVVWREQPKGRRIAAWMKLVKMWAALRFSDAANMQVKTPKYYDGKMTADLHKAKTTGAGKRVQELPGRTRILSRRSGWRLDWTSSKPRGERRGMTSSMMVRFLRGRQVLVL